MVDCPRCLGKGHVDLEDIKRLKKELFWVPGKCAYCNGIGKVPPDRIEKVSVDFEYLTTDLSSLERHKVINANEQALQRANQQKQAVQEFINEIVHQYFIENKEPNDIVNYIFEKQNILVYSEDDKQELIEYIDKVIKSKLNS